MSSRAARDWVDLTARTIILPSANTKTTVGQVVHITDDLAEVLAAGQKRPAPRAVKSLRRSCLEAQKRAGINPPHRFHDLRETFCTAVLAANNNPVTLKETPRHASLTITMRYANVQDAAVRAAFSATTGLIKSQPLPRLRQKKPRHQLGKNE